MVAKTVLGLVVGGVIVEIQAITWFDVIDACIVYIDTMLYMIPSYIGILTRVFKHVVYILLRGIMH